MAPCIPSILTKETDMKIAISLGLLAMLLAACDTTGYQEPVTVVGNGTEPCAKKECITPSDVKDKR